MDKYEKIIYGYIILFLTSSTLFSIMLINDLFFDLNKYSYFLIGTGCFSLLIIVYGLIKKYHHFDIYDLLIILLIIFGIISTIFAIHTKISIWGTIYRKEGLLVIITYYLLFLLSKKITNKKYISDIINAFLILGIYNVIYGVFQTVPFLSEISSIKQPWMYAKGTFGNSNFYGTYMILQLSLSLGMYTCISKKYIPYVFLYTFGVVLSGCMGCIVSLICIYMLVFVYSIVKKKINYKKAIFVIIFLITTFLIIANTTQSEIVKDLNQFVSEVSSIITEGLKKEYGSSRIHIWSNTLKEVPNNLLSGVGIDNFMYAFEPRLRTLDHGLIVDKAHNEYLQKLLTEGIFSLITYLILLILIFMKGLKNIKRDSIYIPLLLVFIGYSIQAFFNISVTRVAPFFFIFSGLLISLKSEENV